MSTFLLQTLDRWQPNVLLMQIQQAPLHNISGTLTATRSAHLRGEDGQRHQAAEEPKRYPMRGKLADAEIAADQLKLA